MIQACTRRCQALQSATRCYKALQDATRCILVHFGVFWCVSDILVHSGAFCCILVHFGAFWCILVHFGAGAFRCIFWRIGCPVQGVAEGGPPGLYFAATPVWKYGNRSLAVRFLISPATPRSPRQAVIRIRRTRITAWRCDLGVTRESEITKDRSASLLVAFAECESQPGAAM